MSIRSKLGLETYAPVTSESNGALDDELSNSAVSNEIDEFGDITEKISKALVTLEAIANVIEATTALTPAEANTLNAAIDCVSVGLPISERARSSESQSDLRKAALEDLSSKLYSLKETIAKIIDKIIELIQRFWQWLTLNKKRVEKRLNTAALGLKQTQGKRDVKTSPIMRTISGNDFDVKTLIENGHALQEASTATGVFIESGFKAVDGVTIHTFQDTNVYADLVRDAFSGFKQEDDQFYLYEDIGGRTLVVTILKKNAETSPFVASVISEKTSTDLPEFLTLDEKEAQSLLDQAKRTVETSTAAFAKVERTIDVLKRVANSRKENIATMFTAKTLVLSSYSRALNILNDGVFANSLRYANIVAQVVEGYTKQAKQA